MVTGNDVAKWFIFHNPVLASGYIDENVKINKLAYFSNLMYYSVYGSSFISDDFIAFPNGPVIFSIYRDYRYNGLNMIPSRLEPIDAEYEKVLNITDFVYGDRTADELVKESHTHNLWQDVKHLIPGNPKIDFNKTDSKIIEYNRNLYDAYSSMDFSRIRKDKIGGNIYYYMDGELEITEDIVEILSDYKSNGEPKFLELIEGELVIS